MNIVLYSNKIDEYLKHDNVIDYANETVTEMADILFRKANNEFDFIKTTYEFVRDNISHSADIKILEKLRKNKTRTELWDDLPTELEYNK